MGHGGLRELAAAHQVLAREHAQTRGTLVVVLQVLRRGLWGRLKWLLTGQ